MNTSQIKELANLLLKAERDLQPTAPLTASFPEMTVDDAYAIQLQIVAAKKAAGRKIVGRKIGLTAKVMQQMMGVKEPDYGILFDDMVVENGANIPAATMIQPKVEAEIGFVLGGELQGPGITANDALKATSHVVPVLEIIDSRITDWKIKLPDTVADNASSARVVVGKSRYPAAEFDLRLIGMAMDINGDNVASGAGAAVMGHPANAVAWLANKMASVGEKLHAGHLIIPGSLCAAITVKRGDKVTANFDRLGTVEVTFE